MHIVIVIRLIFIVLTSTLGPFLLFAFSFPTSTWAENVPLSLSQAIGKAKSQSPERVTLMAQQESLLAKKRRSFAPVSTTFSIGFGDLGAPPGPENSNLRTYQLSQTLGFPGKASAEARGWELESQSIGFSLEGKDQEIARSVKVAFYQLWLIQRKLELNELRRSSFEKISLVAKRRFVKNTTTEVEFLTAQAAIRSVDNEKADFHSAEKISRAKLNILMGQSPDQHFQVQAPPIQPLPLKLERPKLRQFLLERNPSIKAVKRKSDAFQSRVILAERSALPDFKFSAGTNSLSGFSGGVQLTIPTWFWWNEKEGIKGANQDLIGQEADTETQKRHLTDSFETLVSSIEALQEKLENYRSNLIPIYKRSFQVALANYGYGKIDFPTLTGSANSYVNSQIEYETLLTDFLSDLAQLEEFLGGALP